MSTLCGETVRTVLETCGIAVDAERRGYETRRGVPDSVVWLSPDHQAFSDRLVPVLVELEGTFAAAARDFVEFSNRYSDPDHQYHVNWPAAAENLPPREMAAQYDMIGISAKRLAGTREIEEEAMHEAIEGWFESFIDSFKISVRDRSYGETEILYWKLRFPMFGHRFETEVPIFVTIGDNLEAVLDRYIATMSLPSVVVVNDLLGGRKETTADHATMVEFDPLRSIRFR